MLAKVRGASGRVVWLNPEPEHRWNSGDSVMDLYRRHCDVVLAAGSLRELQAALAHVF